MDSVKFILAPHPPENPSDPAWYKKLEEISNQLNLKDSERLLEFPAKRAGFPGMVHDNPLIEDIDRIIETAAHQKFRFASFFIPFDLNKNEEDLQHEISNINGWTDMAAFTDVEHVRLSLLNWSADSFKIQDQALNQIISYLNDMEISISLSTTSNNLKALSAYIQSFKTTTTSSIGLDYQLLRDKSFTLTDDESELNSISSITTQISPPYSKQSIESIKNQLTNQSLNPTRVFLQLTSTSTF